jgi:hypothetical protein
MRATAKQSPKIASGLDSKESKPLALFNHQIKPASTWWGRY